MKFYSLNILNIKPRRQLSLANERPSPSLSVLPDYPQAVDQTKKRSEYSERFTFIEDDGGPIAW